MSEQSSQEYRLEVVYPRSVFDRTRDEVDLQGLTVVGSIHGGTAYASPDLVEEVTAIRSQGGLPRGNVYHATSSVALAGIAHHGALLSSKRLVELGEQLVTGEITTAKGSLHVAHGGLEDVYASSSPNSLSYAETRFDEYPVIFGLNPRPFAAYHSAGDYGDGVKLGPNVPLTAVQSVTVPHTVLHTAAAWTHDNCHSSTLVLSHLAAQVVTHCG